MNLFILLLGLLGTLPLGMSIYFFSKKKEENRIFALFLFLFAYNILFNILFWTNFDEKYFGHLHFTYLLPLSLYGPLFYLYLRVKTLSIKIGLKDILHFIPFYVTVFLYGGYFFLKSSKKIEVFTNKEWLEYIVLIPYYEEILVFILLVYSIASYRKFIGHYKNDRQLSIWFNSLNIGFMGFVFSYVLYDILADLDLLKIEYDYFITLMMILFVSVVSYLNYSYPALFNGKPINKIIPFIKYRKTGLDTAKAVELKEQLIDLMLTHKPYLNPEIKLDDIVSMLNSNRHYISQIINEHFQSNFFEFINKYRIDEARRLLKNKQADLNISEIAYKSGFNNRASFYKSFKKHCNLTPTEYRSMHA